jgi:hypothetical protein
VSTGEPDQTCLADWGTEAAEPVAVTTLRWPALGPAVSLRR